MRRSSCQQAHHICFQQSQKSGWEVQDLGGHLKNCSWSRPWLPPFLGCIGSGVYELEDLNSVPKPKSMHSLEVGRALVKFQANMGGTTQLTAASSAVPRGLRTKRGCSIGQLRSRTARRITSSLRKGCSAPLFGRGRTPARGRSASTRRQMSDGPRGSWVHVAFRLGVLFFLNQREYFKLF